MMPTADAPRFTVFTPTYNRARTLPGVYESLMSQTRREFEWLIVDDGSTDDTRALVEDWRTRSETFFPVRCAHQEHGHKKKAHNAAILLARGDYIVILDSDDRCVPEALERFAFHLDSISPELRPRYLGVAALCRAPDGRIIGDRFPGATFFDSNTLELEFRHKVRGEKWAALRTDALREYPFPEEIPGYLPEGIIWSRISRRYLIRCVNEPLRIYCEEECSAGGRAAPRIMSTRDPAANAAGHFFWKHQVLSEDIDYFTCAPGRFCLDAARLVRFYLHLPPRLRGKLLPSSTLGRFLVVLMYPVGAAWRWFDRIRSFAARSVRQ